jgi:hypothetical protein
MVPRSLRAAAVAALAGACSGGIGSAAPDAAPPPRDAPPPTVPVVVVDALSAAEATPLRPDAGTPDAATAPAADWWDPRWPRRRPVTLTHPGPEELVDFPVPVMLPPALADEAALAGVRFVDAAGKPLPHEIERGPANIAWVRIPRLAAGPSSFWLYHGNPAPTPPSGPEVWPPPYAAVWHFAGDARDATTRHHDGMKVQARFGPGPLGQAAALDGTRREHIGLVADSDLVSGAAGVTVSLMVQHQGMVRDGQDIILGIGTAATTGHLSRVSVAISPELGLIGEANPDEGAWDVTSSAPNTVPNGQWQYVTVVIDVRGKTIQLYRNGQPLGSPFPGKWRAAAYQQTPANRVTIGCEEDESKSFFSGLIDELRVEGTARSAAWIAAQARAVAGKMVTVGDEQMVP